MLPEKSLEARDIIRPAADRVPLSIAIAISGTDRLGRTFTEDTRTIEISGRGARIATTRELVLGSELSIKNALGETAVAKVVWRNESGSTRGINEFGIVLLASPAPESLWRDSPSPGPPENEPPDRDPASLKWLPENQATDGTPSPPLPGDSGPALVPATAEIEPVAELETHSPSAPVAEAPGGSRSAAQVSWANHPPQGPLDPHIAPQVPLPAILSATRDDALEGPQPLQPVVQESDAAPALAAEGTEASLDSAKASKAVQVLDVNVALRSIDFAVEAALARVQAARGTAESELVSRIEGYEERLRALASSAVATVEDSSETLVQSLEEHAADLSTEILERSSGQLQQQGLAAVQTANEKLSTLTADLIDETSSRLNRVVQGASESLAEQSKRISDSQLEAIAALKEQTDAAYRIAADGTASLAAIRRRAEADLRASVAEVSVALKSIDTSASEAVSRLRAAQEAIESSLAAKVEEAERRLSGLSLNAIARIEEDPDAIDQSLRSVDSSTAEAVARLQNAQEAMESSFAAKVEEAERLLSELSSTAIARIEEAPSVLDETLKSIDSSASEAVSRLRAAQEAIESSLAAKVEEAERRLSELSLNAIARIEESPDAIDQGLRSIDSSAAEAVARLRAAQEAIESSFAARVEEAERRLSGLALNAIARIEENPDAINQGLRSIDSSAAEAVARLRAAQETIESSFAAKVEEAERRLSGLSLNAIARIKENPDAIDQGLRSIDSSAAEAVARLRAAQESIESSFAAKVEEAERRLSGLSLNVIARIKENPDAIDQGLRPVDSSAAEAVARLRTAQEAIESSFAAKVEEAERRLSGLALSAIARIKEDPDALGQGLRSIESSAAEAVARLQNAQEAMESSFAAKVEDAERLLSELSSTATARIEEAPSVLDETLRSIDSSAAQAESRLRAAEEAMESSLAAKIEEAERRLSTVVSTATARIEEAPGVLDKTLESIESSAAQVLSRLRAAQAAAESSVTAKVEEAERRLSGLASGAIAVVEGKSKALAESVSENVQTTSEELLVLKTRLIDDARGQIKRAAQEASESLTWESQRASESQAHRSLQDLASQRADMLRTAGEELRGLKMRIEGEIENDLVRAADGALASLARDSRRMLEDYRNRASLILEEQVQTLARNTEVAIHNFSSTQQKLADSLHSRIAENERCLAEQLNAAMETFGRNREAILTSARNQTQRELALLSHEAAQAAQTEMHAYVDGSLKTGVRPFQAQAEPEHTASLRAAASRAEFMEQMKKELSELTQGAMGSLTEEIRTILNEQSRELHQRLAAIEEQSSRALAATQGQWLAKQSETISEPPDGPGAGASGQMLAKSSFSVPARARSVLRRSRVHVAVAASVALISFSLRPVRRLKTTPPDEFLDESYRVTEGGPHAEQQKLAQAYWECALQQIQPRYSSTADLPESPPPEFQVDVTQPAPDGPNQASDTRLSYWRRLRAAWSSPSAWDRSYEWNADWLRSLAPARRSNRSR